MKLPAGQKVELAFRAAHLAKAALELLGMDDVQVAELQLVVVVREVKEVDDFLQRAKRGQVAQAARSTPDPKPQQGATS